MTSAAMVVVAVDVTPVLVSTLLELNKVVVSFLVTVASVVQVVLSIPVVSGVDEDGGDDSGAETEVLSWTLVDTKREVAGDPIKVMSAGVDAVEDPVDVITDVDTKREVDDVVGDPIKLTSAGVDAVEEPVDVITDVVVTPSEAVELTLLPDVVSCDVASATPDVTVVVEATVKGAELAVTVDVEVVLTTATVSLIVVDSISDDVWEVVAASLLVMLALVETEMLLWLVPAGVVED